MRRVIVQDLRSARFCLRGARGWFARHEIDWQAFLRDGVEADVLAATGDALAFRAISEARARWAREQGDG